jgi:voltage-gated sodium channel
MKKLRHIVSAILVSAPHVFWAAVLEMIIFYIFGIMGQNLFHEAFPQWFGTLGETVYTLFQVTTLESWSMGIARPVMKVYPWAWMYFVPFVMISSYEGILEILNCHSLKRLPSKKFPNERSSPYNSSSL